MTSRALVEMDAGIGGHRLDLAMTAKRASNSRVENQEPPRKVGVCLTVRA
jgi:hypothetical protein